MSVSRLYLTGLPGSGHELDLLPERPEDLLVLDRNGYRYFGAMAKDLGRYSEGRPVHLIGFSLGAHAALRLAAAAPERVSALTLVSPAGPLELGRFLPGMAGASVFRLARWPILFRGFARLQRMLALRAPSFLAAQLIKSMSAPDKAFFADTEHRITFERILVAGFDANYPTYRRELPTYVRPWSDRLARIKCPVTIWQGTEDRWTPPAMAEALYAALPDGARLNRVEGAGHYTTLVRKADEIFAVNRG
ncbi:alpha/beta hydrolase [Primorskyibacter aestuariivivens]|uniref:alpha/beta hydrolase n=1 Tax=Primorskyibacter aestuariivivens TaxID=1888912 RepID=UPI0022FFFE3F|nr:alpha/beta hydrolase [Primorskyibacter aestuariivivens]MDA7430727.1 alpha/beta hydrolase [Primorskyibacter aestuariivivens]